MPDRLCLDGCEAAGGRRFKRGCFRTDAGMNRFRGLEQCIEFLQSIDFTHPRLKENKNFKFHEFLLTAGYRLPYLGFLAALIALQLQP